MNITSKMAPIEKQKVLLCGDVEGKFDVLFKRVENIVKKSGPFDILLCVGNFFGINNREFTPYKLGDKKVPIPTYILGPNQREHLDQYPSDESQFELCHNVYYLGKRGVYTNSTDLKIAYVSGTAGSDPWNHSEKDISDLCDLCIKGNPSFRGVDILLTSQWPSGIVDDTKKASLSPTSTSPLLSYACMKLKPRYVVSGLEGVHYERPPFRCPSLGDEDSTFETVTRFIGLARVGNAAKDKWIYALSLTPLSKMKIGELLQKTTDETACPFDIAELESQIFGKTKRKATPGATQYFYDVNEKSVEERPAKRMRKPQVEFDTMKCWFCLASPSVEKHLIISVGDKCYLALAKGGLVEEHFLICPIEHYQSNLVQPEDAIKEMELFKEALRKFYARKDEMPVFFERNYKTSHMQLHAIPIPKRANRELKEIFIDESDSQGFKLEQLEPGASLGELIPPKVPYFAVELPDGTSLYTKVQTTANFPLNFAREVLASGPVLGLPDKTDWRECLLPKEAEIELMQRLRREFEPFDFTV